MAARMAASRRPSSIEAMRSSMNPGAQDHSFRELGSSRSDQGDAVRIHSRRNVFMLDSKLRIKALGAAPHERVTRAQ